MKTLVQILVVVTVFSCGASAGIISVVSLSPRLSAGCSTSVDISVSGLSDLYAFQFDIIFNPSVLSAVNVTEGSLFSSVGIAFNSGTIDNTAGTITFIADSLSGLAPGLNLDGPLAQILFNAVGHGSSSIDLSNVILLNSNLRDITPAAVPGGVNVTDAPEPNYGLVLFGISLIAFLARPSRASLRRYQGLDRS